MLVLVLVLLLGGVGAARAAGVVVVVVVSGVGVGVVVADLHVPRGSVGLALLFLLLTHQETVWDRHSTRQCPHPSRVYRTLPR